MLKLRIFLIALFVSVLMTACGSDDNLTTSAGGPLTLGVTQSGSVVEDDVVVYTITLDDGGGANFNVDLVTTSGDADLEVCDSLNCSVYYGSSGYEDLEPDSVPVVIFGTETLYIFVEGFYSSRYEITVYLDISNYLPQ